MKCSMVPHEHVKEVWPQVKEYLEDAAKYTYGRYEADDIYESIIDQDHTLWVAFDKEGTKGAVVTNFVFYPRKKYLVMAFCGGVQLDQWKDQMLKLLQHFAHDTYCDGVESTGRPGWTKIFQHDGHKPLWQTFQLPAADAGLGVSNG